MSTREKLLAATVLIFFVCVVVWAVQTTPSEPPPIEKVDPPTVVEYEGNTIVEEKDGQIIWELTCSKMTIDSTTQNIELNDLIWKFHQPELERVWELKAAKGIFYKKDENMHVEGDVILTNTDGAKMVGDNLDWFGYQKLLTATGNIIVTKADGAELIGDKVSWLIEEEQVMAEGNIVVTNTDGAKLWSDKINWLVKEEKITAEGNVRIHKDDVRAFGDFAYADNDFKHFGLMGNAKILKGVKDN